MSNQIVCPQCKSPISSSDKFCSNCGAKIERYNENPASHSSEQKIIACPACGSANEVSNSRCQNCGSELHKPVPANLPRQQQTSKNKAKNSKRKKFSLSSVVMISFVILSIVVIALEYRTMNDSPRQNETNVSTPSNQNNNPAMLDEISSLEKTVEADPSNSDALLQLANRLHDAKFFPRAIEAYKKFLKLNPKDTDARVDLGICYFEMGESETAQKEIESVLKIEPKHQMAMFNLGIINLNSGNVPEAKKWFNKCAEIDPASTTGKRAKELLTQHSF